LDYFRTTKLTRGRISLSPGSENLVLEKYTVANAMALSVKLGIWESTLDKFVESIDEITEVSLLVAKPFTPEFLDHHAKTKVI